MHSFTNEITKLGELSPELRREIASNFDPPGVMAPPQATGLEDERRLIIRIVAIVCVVCAFVIMTSA